MLAGPQFGRSAGDRPNIWVGALVAVAMVGAATGAIYALKPVAAAASLGVVYLPAVLVASAYWGLALGIGTSLLSAAAFNFFHLPPTGRLTIADSRNWVALAAFVIVAAVVSTIAELARSRAAEAERRRSEADLAAALARELLAGAGTREALAATARRVSEALALPSASIVLGGGAQADPRRQALPLNDGGGEQIATLLVPRDLPPDIADRLRSHVVPALEALVAIAIRRDALQAEAVETEALRRSDDIKTALLRAVSHDLRTPLTAIVAAGHALGTDSLSSEERVELSEAVVDEGERLAMLVEKLLDLSKLQSGHAEPRREWVSLEDLLLAAREGLAGASDLRLSIDPDVPEVRADAAQLERAFANLLENARRYSGGQPVSINVRRSGDQIIVRVVDRGPGIGPSERERIFEAFYRGPQAARTHWTGSGLGLAIARGFVEANGGTISVESLPGQGTTFAVSLPISEQPAIKVGT